MVVPSYKKNMRLISREEKGEEKYKTKKKQTKSLRNGQQNFVESSQSTHNFGSVIKIKND